MKKIAVILLIVLVASPFVGFAQKAQNPENSDVFLSKSEIAHFVGDKYVKGTPAKGYAENPANLTKEELVDTIANYIQRKSINNDGYLRVYDAIVNRPLDLSLIKVHGDCLKYLGDNIYFDCGYFNGKEDGNRYDVDIFMEWDGEKMKEVKSIVHKVNYMPRFDWVDGGTIFRAVPLTKSAIQKYSKEREEKLNR